MTVSPFQPISTDPSPLSEQTQAFDMAEFDEAKVGYGLSRLYYQGEQYEAENELTAQTLGYEARNRRLPEHLRRHAYSSHIGEAVDVLSDMLAEGITFDGAHAELLNGWWAESHMDSRADDWIREALITGNVYAQPLWDPEVEKMTVDVWEAEAIWPVYKQDDWTVLDYWYRFTEFVEDGIVHRERRLYVLKPVIMPDDELVTQVFVYQWIDEEYQTSWRLNSPLFNLVHGRGDSRRRLRSSFGESLITPKVRGTADRYNAIGQLGFRVVRQNSFATIAVVGDASFLGDAKKDENIAKDLADVLSFPGGTDVKVIQLPTDPRTMEWQVGVLEKNIYREFGLVKTDMEDMTGMGTVSGYALEVLNRKERATHKRIRKNATAMLTELANMMLDMHALATSDADWWLVDPLEVYPNREGIAVTIASGDIVDHSGDRDDFTAGVVSREYVLKRRGLGTPAIDEVQNQVYADRRRLAEIQNEQVLAQQAQSAETEIEKARIAAAAKPSVTGSGAQTGSTQ